ncbi:YtxH domain-containing protein [Bacillus sp. RAR_GA_16]|uniref:YtxH domain-containing protein n=1 Tax=Bacillus sp. RAR_GA_16 TaxID=2876774 RepID=UPI001CCB8ACC|nr:YtxH domain-containing protein [Bacillus sp. RAR_GA_16]MCA0171548.1 YtxH domain-containing protein [Bacillus sp. RAR_GA_16]
MSDNNINTKDFIIGTLIGGIVGAAAALLSAPKSGKELRSDLNQQAGVVKDKTSQFRESAVERSTDFANRAKEKSSTIYKQVSDQSNNLVSKIKDRNLESQENEALHTQADADVENFQQDLNDHFSEEEPASMENPTKL